MTSNLISWLSLVHDRFSNINSVKIHTFCNNHNNNHQNTVRQVKFLALTFRYILDDSISYMGVDLERGHFLSILNKIG